MMNNLCFEALPVIQLMQLSDINWLLLSYMRLGAMTSAVSQSTAAPLVCSNRRCRPPSNLVRRQESTLYVYRRSHTFHCLSDHFFRHVPQWWPGTVLSKTGSVVTTSIGPVETGKSDCGIVYINEEFITDLTHPLPQDTSIMIFETASQWMGCI